MEDCIEIVESPASSDDEDEPAPPKWRGDPAETFSDWTIQIRRKEDPDGKTSGSPLLETYHVHKYMLGCGARRSNYFAKLFRNGTSFKEGTSNTSLIDLDALAAEAFPSLLDYVYEPNLVLKITTENAVALLHLGEYFEMKHLRRDALFFCKKAISLKNVDTYYEHATAFHNEAILDSIAKLLGKNILKVDPCSAIVCRSSAELWVRVLEYVEKLSSRNVSNHISRLVAEMTTLDTEAFCLLTEAAKIPTVDAEMALSLVELEDIFCPSGCNNRTASQDKSRENSVGADTASSNRSALTSLQRRCATALSEDWQRLGKYVGNDPTRLEHRQPSFLVDLLVKCLNEAKSDLNDSRKTAKDAKASLKSDMSKVIDGLRRELNTVINEFEEELARMKDAKNEEVRMKNDYIVKLASIEESHQLDIARLKWNNESKISALKRRQKETKERLKEEIEAAELDASKLKKKAGWWKSEISRLKGILKNFKPVSEGQRMQRNYFPEMSIPEDLSRELEFAEGTQTTFMCTVDRVEHPAFYYDPR